MRIFGRYGILVKKYNEIKWFIQRGRKGYCEKDLWSIDHWMATTFARMLEDFATENLGYPDHFAEKMRQYISSGDLLQINETVFMNRGSEEDYDYVVWQNTVIEMSRLFKKTNLEKDAITDNEARENLKCALKLLEICYFDLFW